MAEIYEGEGNLALVRSHQTSFTFVPFLRESVYDGAYLFLSSYSSQLPFYTSPRSIIRRLPTFMRWKIKKQTGTNVC